MNELWMKRPTDEAGRVIERADCEDEAKRQSAARVQAAGGTYRDLDAIDLSAHQLRQARRSTVKHALSDLKSHEVWGRGHGTFCMESALKTHDVVLDEQGSAIEDHHSKLFHFDQQVEPNPKGIDATEYLMPFKTLWSLSPSSVAWETRQVFFEFVLRIEGEQLRPCYFPLDDIDSIG